MPSNNSSPLANGTDGFRIGYKPTLRKVVSDRRASLDGESEVRPEMRSVVKTQFEKGARLPIVAFPTDAGAVQDSPKLTLVIVDPDQEWTGDGELKQRIAEWTKQRGKSPRLYPGSLVWCVRKPGRDLRDKVEAHLAWKRVAKEESEGHLGAELDPVDRSEIRTKLRDAEDEAKDEVWGAYRFAVISDGQDASGLRALDLGAGHSSHGVSLCERVIGTLKSHGLLNESVGAGYLQRNWPPALKDSGEWPLNGLRQAFLNGSLTRLVDPDTVLKQKIVEFVEKGEFGLASGKEADGSYERVWFEEAPQPEDVAFDGGVYLLTKQRAASAAQPIEEASPYSDIPPGGQGILPEPPTSPVAPPSPGTASGVEAVLRVAGTIPAELWQRVGTKLIPKLRAGDDATIRIDMKARFKAELAGSAHLDLQQAVNDLGVAATVAVSKEEADK